jgi:hypothetical protein
VVILKKRCWMQLSKTLSTTLDPLLNRWASVSSLLLKILKKNKFHPSTFSCIRNCRDTMPVVADQLLANGKFFSLVLFSDQMQFHNKGTVNWRNMHYWRVDNPHWAWQTALQIQWGDNVWCGILWGHMIGPHFFKNNHNAYQYQKFLQNDLPLLSEEITLWMRLHTWYQYDRALPHWLTSIWNHMDKTYPRRWTGRGGPIQ